MAATLAVFYNDPAGTALQDNWPAATTFEVDNSGNLTVVCTTAAAPIVGKLASYAASQWKRVKWV